MVTVGDVVAAMSRRYPPSWAEPWDAVGLTCGADDADVQRILFAVDPAPAVVAEAIEWRADLVVTHHPLLLRGVHSMAASSPKGRIVHELIGNGMALFSAHTNADSAQPGVSDALADALGLVDLEPLAPMAARLDKIVTFVPRDQAQAVLDVLAAAGAGQIGDYDRCGYWVEGTGTFRPLPGANPAIGQVGDIETVAETRLEMVMPRERRASVVAALRASHPYEEPAFDVIELAGADRHRGLGRVGHLPEPETLEDLLVRVAAAVPATAGGVQAGGDPDRVVQRIAVCGGAGDPLLDSATRAAADAFVTADLRHHPASEALDAGGSALVNLSHWASEWPWLPVAAELLAADLGVAGSAVEMRVSETCTDPWTMHAESLSRDLLEDDD
jgi:dinuclear metal center YbgI/SA1388 family protein